MRLRYEIYMFKVEKKGTRTRSKICPKLTVKNLPKVNSYGTKTTLILSFWCLYWTYFTPCSSFFYFNSEKVNAGRHMLYSLSYIAVNQRCFSRKVFYKYLDSLQENIHAKAWLQLYWNHTSAWVFFCKYATYLQQNALFLERTSSKLLMYIVLNVEVINAEVFSKQVEICLKYISIL